MFTVYLGSNKVVVLTGYKTVKEALVDHAEAFGDRDQVQIVKDHNREHGKGKLSLLQMILFL